MKRFMRFWLPTLLAVALSIPGAWMLAGRPDILSAQPIFSNTFRFVDAPSGTSPSILPTGLDANIGGILAVKGTGGWVVQGPLTVNGLFTAVGGQSLGAVSQQLFVNANDNCYADNTAAPMIRTRLATGDWALARTAAGAETDNIECAISLPSQITASKGFRIDSFSIVHQITVVNLTSATFQQLSTTTYANNVANSIAQYGGAPTITMPTVVQANPYVTAATLAAPAFQNVTNSQVVIDWQVVLANTGVYRVYGVIINFTGSLY